MLSLRWTGVAEVAASWLIRVQAPLWRLNARSTFPIPIILRDSEAERDVQASVEASVTSTCTSVQCIVHIALNSRMESKCMGDTSSKYIFNF